MAQSTLTASINWRRSSAPFTRDVTKSIGRGDLLSNDGAETDTQDRQNRFLAEDAYPGDDDDVLQNRRIPATPLGHHNFRLQNRQHHSLGERRRRRGDVMKRSLSRELLLETAAPISSSLPGTSSHIPCAPALDTRSVLPNAIVQGIRLSLQIAAGGLSGQGFPKGHDAPPSIREAGLSTDTSPSTLNYIGRT